MKKVNMNQLEEANSYCKKNIIDREQIFFFYILKRNSLGYRRKKVNEGNLIDPGMATNLSLNQKVDPTNNHNFVKSIKNGGIKKRRDTMGRPINLNR